MVFDLLAGLDEVEIEPYSDEVYCADGDFVYLGTLSSRLQRLGTLILKERKYYNVECQAILSRQKQATESPTLTTKERVCIHTKELPSRIEALVKQKMCIDLLLRIFRFDATCELMTPGNKDTVEVVPNLEVKIFSGWEVAIGSAAVTCEASTSKTDSASESGNLQWPDMNTLTIM